MADRITVLDSWRGISISLVVAGHVSVFRYALPINSAEIPVATLGVKIFFVISGFIITKLALAEADNTGRFSIGYFYLRRAFRILPPLAVYLAALVALASLGVIDQPIHGIAHSALFLCNLSNASCGWFAGHTWSLAFEEQFYLVFPFVLLMGQARRTITVLCVALMTAPLIKVAFHLGYPWSHLSMYTPAFSFIAFGSVCACYETTVAKLAAGRLGNWLTATACASLGVIVAIQSIPAGLGRPLSYLQAGLDTTVLVLCCGWLVSSSLHQDNALTALLKARPLAALGLCSYSLYLWQELFVGPPSVYFVAVNWFAWPLMFPAALLSYLLFEKPSTRVRRLIETSIRKRERPGLPR